LQKFYAAVFAKPFTVQDNVILENGNQAEYTYRQTCSIGAIVVNPNSSPEHIFFLADQELLEAKKRKLSGNLEKRIQIQRPH